MQNRQKVSTTDPEEDLINKNAKISGDLGRYQWLIRILTPVLFGCTLMTNYLLGVNRNKQVSDKFHLWVTPPGYFFAIWGLIYSGLISMVIYNFFKNVWSLKTHMYFGLSNIFNIMWTFVFDIGSVTSVVVASYVLIAMTASIFFTWVEMGNVQPKKITILTYIMRNVWAFYLGWCIAATNINFGMNIVYWWGFSHETQMIVFWICAPLCAIGGFAYNCIKYGKYGALSCFCLWFSVAWAFIGAAITSNKCLQGKC